MPGNTENTETNTEITNNTESNKNNEIFISYKKYKTIKNGDKIALKINEVLKDLIFKSLD